MNCSVCGNPLHGGRTVFRCECGVLTHAQCWNKHIIESHEPPFTLGTITRDDVFMPNEPVQEEGEDLFVAVTDEDRE
jgi:hypothetical protein